MKHKSSYGQVLEVDDLLSKTISNLNAATQTLKAMREEFSKQMISPLLGAKWDFPVNNYSVLTTWLIYDPIAHILFPVHQRESWADLAEKLSEYSGWTVDERILRQTYNRKSNKKCKLE